MNSNDDDDIATKIIKTKKDVSIYLEDGVNIKIASLMTDHGGGGGTMESSAEAIRKKEDACCMATRNHSS